MCEGCGCMSCETCGGRIEDGVCAGCGEPANDCTCQPQEQ